MTTETNYRIIAASSTPEDLEALVQLLDGAGIPYKVEREPSHFDPTFAFRPGIHNVQVGVPEEDYERASSLLLADAGEGQGDEPSYFAEFSDEELLEVLTKPFEWGPDMVAAAKMEMDHRGVEYDDSQAEEIAQESIRQYREPKSAKWMLVFAATLGLLGAGIGVVLTIWILIASGTDPNGKRYLYYNKASRQFAAVLAVLCVGIFVLSLIFAPFVVYFFDLFFSLSI